MSDRLQVSALPFILFWLVIGMVLGGGYVYLAGLAFAEPVMNCDFADVGNDVDDRSLP